ncbi:MAG: hypothetical protein NUV84_03195 [Candidatus Uhrbacteria bacterium]|nr:hypothetical protein [Candidatus Uhrbacteria bacterium]
MLMIIAKALIIAGGLWVGNDLWIWWNRNKVEDYKSFVAKCDGRWRAQLIAIVVCAIAFSF